jgi:hypothetical protein
MPIVNVSANGQENYIRAIEHSKLIFKGWLSNNQQEVNARNAGIFI